MRGSKNKRWNQTGKQANEGKRRREKRNKSLK